MMKSADDNLTTPNSLQIATATIALIWPLWSLKN